MTSKDILNITLSVSVLVATGFWVWFLYYLIRMVRSASGMVEDFRDRLQTIDEILQSIKDKVTSTHLQLGLMADGVKQVLNFLNNRRSKRSKNSKRASADGDDL